jgi:hypothetical protein
MVIKNRPASGVKTNWPEARERIANRRRDPLAASRRARWGAAVLDSFMEKDIANMNWYR